MDAPSKVEQTSTFTTFPPHILLNIIGQLAKPEASSLSRTCTYLHEEAQVKVWERLDFGGPASQSGGHDLDLAEAAEIFERWPQRLREIKALSMWGFGEADGLQPNTCLYVLRSRRERTFTNLGRLRVFTACQFLELTEAVPQAVVPWLRHTPNLVELKVSINAGDFDRDKSRHTTVRTLKLRSLEWKSSTKHEKLLLDILEASKKTLLELRFDMFQSTCWPPKEYPNEMVRQLVSSASPSLQTLTTLALKPDFYPGDEFLPDLQNLDFIDLPETDNACDIPARPQLRTLTFCRPGAPICRADNCTYTLNIPFMVIFRLETAKSLTDISIRYDSGVSSRASIRDFPGPKGTLYHIVYTIPRPSPAAHQTSHLTSYRGRLIPYELLCRVYALSTYDIAAATFDSRQLHMESDCFDLLDAYVQRAEDCRPDSICEDCVKWAETLFKVDQPEDED